MHCIIFLLPKVILINIKEDLGPASKYLGPLMNYYQLLKDNILVVIDDDRKYGKNLIRNFNIGYNSFPNIIRSITECFITSFITIYKFL